MINEKEIQFKIEELEKRVSILTKNIKNDVGNITLDKEIVNEKLTSQKFLIDTAIGGVNTLQERLADVLTDITTLKETVSERDLDYDNIVETFNYRVKETINCGKKFFRTVKSDKVFFTCTPTCKVFLKLKINGLIETSLTELTPVLKTYVDDTLIDTIEYQLTGPSDISREVYYEFIPKTINHNVHVEFYSGSNTKNSYAEISTLEFDITGRNILILNRDESFKVFLTKDYFFLTKNVGRNGYYALTPTGDVNLDVEYTQIPKILPDGFVSSYDNYRPYNYTYVPIFVHDTVNHKYTINHSDRRFTFCSSLNSLCVSCRENWTANDSSTVKNISLIGSTFIVCSPGEKDNKMLATAQVQTGANYKLSLTLEAYVLNIIKSVIKVNDEPLTQKWVANTPVFFKYYEDDDSKPYYCVGTDEYGQNYLFLGVNNSYCVPLGFGTQTNAYLQTDDSITVYMRVNNCVIKKILKKNSFKDNKYEIVSSKKFINAWEVIESYNPETYFINELGTWKFKTVLFED